MDIGDLDVHVGGGVLLDVANWIVGLLKNKLKGTLENALQKALQKAADDTLDKFLESLPLDIHISGTDLGLNYTMTSATDVASDYVEQATVARVVDVNDPANLPPIPPAALMPGFDPSGREFQVRLSQYTISSGLYAAYNTGLIDFTLTDSMIKPGSKVQLDTTSLGVILPALPEKYGYGKPCNL